MSYIGHNKYCADIGTAYTHIITQMVAMGWVLHDNIAAQNKVYKSNGEDAAKIYGYIRIYVSGNTIGIEAWLYWNNSTHAGTCQAYASNNTVQCNAVTVGVYGNADQVLIIPSNASYYALLFGHVPTTFYSTPKAVLASPASSGTNVTITVDSTEDFSARYYVIVGSNNEGRDRIAVASVTDSTQMVIANLPRNYEAGSVISPLPFAFGVHNCNENKFWPVVDPDFSSTTTGSSTQYWKVLNMFGANITNPDNLIGPRYLLVPALIYKSNGTYLGEIGYMNGNILVCAGVTQYDVFGVMTDQALVPEIGTATSGGASTLTDTAKSWTTDVYDGWYIYIATGAGAGQAREIASNTDKQITVSVAWATQPDNTSTYKIVQQIYRVAGNNVWLAALESSYE